MRLKLPDGTSWPCPAMKSDESNGPAWRVRYTPENLSRGDLLQLASIAEAYGYLLFETTQAQRNYVCREVRRILTTADGDKG